jgi:LysR family transcriptional regulator, glycine cleavage system transcriptional activator
MSSTVRRRLPPLNSLRAFEAAGRRLSFTLAADEIGVTLSAVSHQIRQLENVLGAPLFRRTGRRIELSEEGRLLMPGLTEGFERIVRTMTQFEARRPTGVLTVSMLSTFAMRWFIPRLQRFHAACPEIEVRMSTAVDLTDLERDDIDCAIRFGHGAWPGLHADRLFAEQLVPICHPRLATGEQPLCVPADLRLHRLLHARLRPDDWRMWLHAAGVQECDPSAGLTFETRNFVIQAALDGIGIAIVDPSLVSEELAAGRLVRPFARSLPGEGAYYFVCLESMLSTPRVARFRAWLVAETRSPVPSPEY